MAKVRFSSEKRLFNMPKSITFVAHKQLEEKYGQSKLRAGVKHRKQFPELWHQEAPSGGFCEGLGGCLGREATSYQL